MLEPEAPERPEPVTPVEGPTPAKPKAVPAPVAKPAESPAQREQRERYLKGLAQTRGGFVARLSRLFRGRPQVSEDLKDEVETVLFTADIGVRTAQKMIELVSDVLDKSTVADPDAVWSVIRKASLEILDVPAPPLDYDPTPGPYVLLMIGVNGVGKTTTLGKLAAMHKAAGRKVLLVAGDTFRAAACEQLEVWAQRVGAGIHLGKENADPSSVIHDGIARGRDEGYDIVLCDTAGRLHTKKELMAELGKIRRACAKAMGRGLADAEAEAIAGPHDTFLVLDATIGQNALAQAELFKETMDFTGLVLTKLDGTAKGGVILGVCDSLRVPVRFVGIGERVDDLREFDPEMFVDALFAPQEGAA
ncbi:MAG: signal recognition particle-docking protein FtsY [Myxococcales bacterium]|nr:signal recognition particle-docking protein FtsY [Myxococcales bacterium]